MRLYLSTPSVVFHVLDWSYSVSLLCWAAMFLGMIVPKALMPLEAEIDRRWCIENIDRFQEKQLENMQQFCSDKKEIRQQSRREMIQGISHLIMPRAIARCTNVESLPPAPFTLMG
ncbi:hypothetical protein V6N12_018287 [Hibiscus sabdariffa]|uniref:Uncharacterized protein n=1 Tax=Hibiscus sabdariffa TaxID=183260 RepID=A0ABR2BQ82_9ROSI